jgi:6-phosphogluconolactonase (cycloisomerase 2 family)
VLALVGGLAGCASGSKTFLYVTGPGSNDVFQFQIHANGSLMALNPANVSVGSSPASVAIRPAGDFAYIANSAGNNVTLLAVNKGNGQLSVPVNTNPVPQPTPPNIFSTGTTPIAVVAHPASPFLYILNAGSNDISSYVIDPKTGNLQGSPPVCAAPSPAPPAPCTTATTFPLNILPGVAITPKGNLLFVGNTALSSISVFNISSTGALTAAAPVGLGTVPAGMVAEASGRFLYVADPNNNRVLGFSIGSNGALTAINGSPFAAGTTPVALATDPQGVLLYVANSGSNNVSAFVIDKNSGALGAISGSPFATAGRGPNFLAATSAFLYVSDQITNDMTAFTIGSNGALSTVPGSPFNVATSPQWIALGP